MLALMIVLQQQVILNSKYLSMKRSRSFLFVNFCPIRNFNTATNKKIINYTFHAKVCPIALIEQRRQTMNEHYKHIRETEYFG